MGKNIQNRRIDIIGIELVPGKPDICLGNGKQEFACCCDECDYYLICYPKNNSKKTEENLCI